MDDWTYEQMYEMTQRYFYGYDTEEEREYTDAVINTFYRSMEE